MKPGEKIGRYELHEQIGEGAMARVFASAHPFLERRVAIKILKEEATHDASYVTRFLDDARAAHALRHPNVIEVIDVDEVDGRPFIVMELIAGSSLDTWRPERNYTIDEAIRIVRDVASALAAAHRAGLVHRDVKPSNILIDTTTHRAKLADFGAAKRERPEDQQLTVVGQRIGTPRYMAPEQVEGKPVDGRSDLFALGATLYELIAGVPAFEGSSVSAVFHAILFGEPPSLLLKRPDVPPPLVRLIERMLAKNPDERPSTAEEVIQTLDAFLEEGEKTITRIGPQPGSIPRPEGAPPQPQPPKSVPAAPRAAAVASAPAKKRSLMPAFGLAGVVALVAVGGAVVFLSQEPSTTGTQGEPGEDPAVDGSDNETVVDRTGDDEPATTGPAPSAESSGAADTDPDADPDADVAQIDPGVTEPGTEPDPVAPPPIETPPVEADTVAGPDLPDCPANPDDAPGCDMVKLALEALGQPDAEPPEVVLNRPNGIYLDQDFLVIDVTMPETLGGFLFVDVFSDTGDVFHLLPEPLNEDNAFAASGEIRIGVEASERAPGIRHWQVTGPFGPAYVLVVASEIPVYEDLRPVAEPIVDYRDVLLEALSRNTGQTTAQVKRIEFRPRQ